VGNIVATFGVSVDGFFEGPNREIDWHIVDDEFHRYVNGVLRESGAFLSGRITHELMASFWPTAAENPVSTPPMVEFAGIWLDKSKFVYSKTLDHADWNTTIVREVVPYEVRALRERFDGDLALSGADLARVFMEDDLIDEYRLYVQPVVLGRGRPLFLPSDAQTKLRLLETRTFGTGVVLLHYGRA
jgi:dihydrofolate reductase